MQDDGNLVIKDSTSMGIWSTKYGDTYMPAPVPAPTPAPVPSSSSACTADCASLQGTCFRAPATLTSPSGSYSMSVREDGTVVVVDFAGNATVFASDSHHFGILYQLVLQVGRLGAAITSRGVGPRKGSRLKDC